MRFLLRFWYIILLALVLSIASAIGLLYIRRGEWMPPPRASSAAEAPRKSTEGSKNYQEWAYAIDEVEDLRVKLEAEREEVSRRRQELDRMEQRLQSEKEELSDMREEIDQLRGTIDQRVIRIQEGEKEKISHLADVYEEMRPASAVTIFNELEIPFVVKILTEMSEDAAARILSEMSEAAGDEISVKRAAEITEEFQRVQ